MEPSFDAASPYMPLAARFTRGLAPWFAAAASQSPSLVADAIFRAVTDPATPFRQLCGPDAQRLGPAYRAAPDFESFAASLLDEAGLQGVLDLPTPDKK
jgi:hypothetical protein